MQEAQTILKEWENLPVEQLVGQTIIAFPKKLLTKNRLFTTQNWVDQTKLRYAINGESYPEGQSVKAWISEETHKGKTMKIFTLGDGNHRTGIAVRYEIDTPIEIVGLWKDQKKRYGFNQIVKQINEHLGMNYD